MRTKAAQDMADALIAEYGDDRAILEYVEDWLKRQEHSALQLAVLLMAHKEKATKEAE